jgi:hypothetical protein
MSRARIYRGRIVKTVTVVTSFAITVSSFSPRNHLGTRPLIALARAA